MPADLVEVGAYASAREAFDHGLVVLALGRPYWLLESPEGQRLLVEPGIAGRVREQFVKYHRESMRWPPRPLELGPVHGTDLITPLLWAVAMLAIFHFQGSHPAWAERGAVDPVAIFERREWWRPATALLLHGDGAHVTSNALSGILLFTAVLKTLGRVRGWLLVTLAAVAANFAVAALAYPGPYRSLGASTALFAGLGLLTGHMVHVLRQSAHPHRGRAILVAAGSGLVVFALYAGGGLPRVDLGAHLAGFVAGGVVGGLAAWISRRTS